MGFFSWIIVGGIAGLIARYIMKEQMGCFMTVIIGIIGGIVGGFVMSLINHSGVSGVNIWSIFVSVIGACIALFVANKLKS